MGIDRLVRSVFLPGCCVAGVIFAAMTAGCQQGPAASSDPAGNLEPEPAPRARSSEAPLAYLDGRPIFPEDLSTALMEAAGPAVLADVVLDRRVADLMAERGLSLPPEAVEQEERILLLSLSSEPDEAARLLTDLRQRRGLGDIRYATLLSRNASLRALIAEDVAVSDAEVRRLYDLRHGPRTRVRMLMVSSAGEASRLRERAEAGESFGELAAVHSSDSSASVGGLLPAISAADPTFPQAVRDAAVPLEPGELSAIVALSGGFAVFYGEAKIVAGGTPLDDVRDELDRVARLQAEQRLMRQLARSLLAEARFTALDPTVQAAWETRLDSLNTP